MLLYLLISTCFNDKILKKNLGEADGRKNRTI